MWLFEMDEIYFLFGYPPPSCTFSEKWYFMMVITIYLGMFRTEKKKLQTHSQKAYKVFCCVKIEKLLTVPFSSPPNEGKQASEF